MPDRQPIPWIQVLIAMVGDGTPEPPIHGIIRSIDERGGGVEGFVSTGRETAVFVGAAGPQWIYRRVWRHNDRLRIETHEGRPLAICDGTWLWRFQGASETPPKVPAAQMRVLGSAARLLLRRSAREWVGDDFTQPNGPIRETTFLDRPAWDLDLKPPNRKPYPIQQVVDQATGLVLQNRCDAAGLVSDEWTEFTEGEPISGSLFTWTGPVMRQAEEQERHRQQHEADMAQRRDWFRRNVTDNNLTVDLRVDLSPYVHTFDDSTGAFEASIGGDVVGGSLARRPRSDEVWELRWSGTVHRWSTRDFDWAVALHGVELPPAGLDALQAALHPSEDAK